MDDLYDLMISYVGISLVGTCFNSEDHCEEPGIDGHVWPKSRAPLGGFKHAYRFKIHMVVPIPNMNILIQCHHRPKLSAYVYINLSSDFTSSFPHFLHADDGC